MLARSLTLSQCRHGPRALMSPFFAMANTETNTTVSTDSLGFDQKRYHNTYNGPGVFEDRERFPGRDNFKERGFTVGIGGPVGSGKTALVLKLALEFKQELPLGVVTNDIFTQEDAEFLVRNNALPKERIAAVETGGCPHAAIREDVSANLSALEKLTKSISKEEKDKDILLLCESGGDNLAANFSRELADFTVYVIDVAGGDKIPRKGGPGITQSDMLIINKIDLAEAVGADLEVMRRDADMMRGPNAPTIFTSVKEGDGLQEIHDTILRTFYMAMAENPHSH